MDNQDYNCIIYTIKQGDTLYSISRRYTVPLALILRANPYVDIYNLLIGDELCIPVIRPMNWNKLIDYVIEEGDTLQSILTKFGIELDDFLQFNNLKDIILQTGMTIKIPIFEE